MQHATAIIPAHNEEVGISGVVKAALFSSMVDDVIVVSDGSTDQTAKLARESGAMVISLQQNVGKAQAMARGVRQTHSDILVFLDADILNLTPQLLDKLVAPVSKGEADMNVLVRDYGTIFNTIQRNYGPLLSGIRALRREIFESVPEEYIRGFRIETALNWSCKKLGYQYSTFIFYGWQHLSKRDKQGIVKGWISWFQMHLEVFCAYIKMFFADLGQQYSASALNTTES
jgi:glycosyltransferase involved in cell wall biosynthesis